MKNYYKVFNVPFTAPIEEIKKLYKELALKLHPDKNPENREEATKKFQELQEAYQVLSDPIRRSKYDREIYAFNQKRSGASSNNPNQTSSSTGSDNAKKANQYHLAQAFANFVGKNTYDCYIIGRPYKDGLAPKIMSQFKIFITSGLDINTQISVYLGSPSLGGAPQPENLRTINMLHMAINQNDPNFVEFLVENGANVNVPVIKPDGTTISPFQLATRDHLRDHKIVSALITEATDINSVDPFLQTTPLFYVARKQQIHYMTAIIQEAQRRGSLESLLTHNGTTLLNNVILNNFDAGVDLLINSSVNINLADNIGNTALHVAIKNGNHAVSKKLMESGAGIISKNNKGETPLSIAVQNKDKENVSAIIEYASRQGNNLLLDNIVEDYLEDATKKSTHLMIASRLSNNPESLLDLAKFQRLTELSDLMKEPEVLIEALDRINHKKQQNQYEQRFNSLNELDMESFEEFKQSSKGKRQLEEHSSSSNTDTLPPSPKKPKKEQRDVKEL